MSRKNRDKAVGKRGEAPVSSSVADGLSERGKKVIGAGAALVVLGFIALSRVDPMGRGSLALLSCFLLAGGYAAMGVGIFLDDPPPSPSSSEKPS